MKLKLLGSVSRQGYNYVMRLIISANVITQCGAMIMEIWTISGGGEGEGEGGK